MNWVTKTNAPFTRCFLRRPQYLSCEVSESRGKAKIDYRIFFRHRTLFGPAFAGLVARCPLAVDDRSIIHSSRNQRSGIFVRPLVVWDVTSAFGFAGCDWVAFGEVVNDLLVADYDGVEASVGSHCVHATYLLTKPTDMFRLAKVPRTILAAVGRAKP